MSQEYWKPVVGYEDSYEVSDQGKVRSLDRIDCKGRFRPSVELVLSTRNKRRPYLSVCLYSCAGKRTFAVHKLVAGAFLGPRPTSLEVLHGPKGPQCNEVSNLRYGTRSENQADRLRDGTDCNGEKSPNAKLTTSTVLEMRQCRKEEKLTYKQLGERFGVDRSTAHNAVSGKRWKHL